MMRRTPRQFGPVSGASGRGQGGDGGGPQWFCWRGQLALISRRGQVAEGVAISGFLDWAWWSAARLRRMACRP